MARSRAAIERDLAVHRDRGIQLREKLDEAKRHARVRCIGGLADSTDGCRKLLGISRLTWVQTHYYVTPYSCNGGDYWVSAEGYFLCPRCGVKNRILKPDPGCTWDSDTKRPDVWGLRNCFGDRKDEHKT